MKQAVIKCPCGKFECELRSETIAPPVPAEALAAAALVIACAIIAVAFSDPND